MDLGAGSVAFDVDFSAASSPQNDAAFAAALDRAGGYVALAGFEQPSGADAALAASIFHFGTYTVEQLKEELDKRGIPMRLAR